MTGPDSIPEGASSSDTSPRRSRRLRPPGTERRKRTKAQVGAAVRTTTVEPCPRLHLASDPEAQAPHVTDDHRCQLRLDLVPDPGHQLAYCLSANHVSCPHFRGYESQLRARMPSVADTGPAWAPPRSAAPGPAPPAGNWRDRVAWAAGVALVALAAAGVLVFLYATPNAQLTVLPETASAAPESRSLLSAGTPAPLSETEAITTATAGDLAAASPPAEVDPAAEPASSGIAGVEEGDAAASSSSFSTEVPAETQPPEPVPVSVYVVKFGDTLLGIAFQSGLSLDALVEANALDPDAVIWVGQRLLVPQLAGPDQ